MISKREVNAQKGSKLVTLPSTKSASVFSVNLKPPTQTSNITKHGRTADGDNQTTTFSSVMPEDDSRNLTRSLYISIRPWLFLAFVFGARPLPPVKLRKCLTFAASCYSLSILLIYWVITVKSIWSLTNYKVR